MEAAIALATGGPADPRLSATPAITRGSASSRRGIGIEPPEPWADENWLALRLPAGIHRSKGLASYRLTRHRAAGTVSGGGVAYGA